MSLSTRNDRGSGGRWISVWLAVSLAASVFFFWRGSQTKPLAGGVRATAVGRAVDAPLLPPAAERTKDIDCVEVGDRVRVDLPARLQEAAIGRLVNVPDWDQLGYQIDPALWRKICLSMDGEADDRFDIVLLRPLTWVEQTGAKPGGTIQLVVPEQGLDGPANVLAVDGCPSIPGGAGHVVTGTFTHIRGDILRLHLEGIAEPLGVTANHTMYSADRDAFILAGELHLGERLRHLDGLTRIQHFERVDGQQRVYNLEIHGAHVYHVSTSGVLVHNASIKTNLARFGLEPESATQLAEQAAKAEQNGFPHGVSTRLTETPVKSARNANINQVGEHFPVEQTGANPNHHTVHLPKPVTQAVADLFNSLFR